MPGAPEAKDETVAGIKVKTLAIKEIPFKNAAITLGQVGGHYLIATTKEAFEKAAGAAAKKETSLAENVEFKALSIFEPSSFISYFMDSEKLAKIASEIAPIKEQSKANEIVKYFAANASLQDNDITGSFIVKTDLAKITPEIVSQFLKDVMEKSSKKGSASGSVNPGGDVQKVTEPEEGKAVGEGDAE